MPIPLTDKRTIDLCPADSSGLFLHASAVNVAGKALLFLGHSTSGKSTISRLLSERYPLIADDKVWICQKNSDWLICDGDTNSQSENRNKFSSGSKKKYPVLAVLRIFKSKTAGIKPLMPRETCRYLVDAVFEIDIQRKQDDLLAKKKWFAFVAEISKKKEGWRLTFKKDKSIIELIHDNFEKRFY